MSYKRRSSFTHSASQHREAKRISISSAFVPDSFPSGAPCNMNSEMMFYHNQSAAPDNDSAAVANTLFDDFSFAMSREGTASTDTAPMFPLDSHDFQTDSTTICDNWVMAQANMISSLTALSMPDSDASLSFMHENTSDAGHWLDAHSQAENIQTDISWNMASQIPSSASRSTQWSDSTSSSDSPRSLPSAYEMESCSPNMMMPALDVGPATCDSMTMASAMPAYITAHWDLPQHSFPQSDHMDSTFGHNEAGVSQMSRPVLDHGGRRMSNESDPSTARSDYRYKQEPRGDGLYHCPIEECNHKPEKLKCNYDKHLDSHLKPYRCKVAACRSVPFSSTACVLRHEREAHGMHGHGNRPYSCHFPDCERSSAENGFPRRWNLHDHMRRVHNYHAKITEKAGSPLTPPESPEIPATGPGRVTKRGGRTNPKIRTSSKDETIKASASRKSNRSSVPKEWLDHPQQRQQQQQSMATMYQEAYPGHFQMPPAQMPTNGYQSWTM